CLLHRQCLCVLMGRPPPTSPVFPYTTLFRSRCARVVLHWRVYTGAVRRSGGVPRSGGPRPRDATSGARIPSCVGRCAVRATELASAGVPVPPPFGRRPTFLSARSGWSPPERVMLLQCPEDPAGCACRALRRPFG